MRGLRVRLGDAGEIAAADLMLAQIASRQWGVVSLKDARHCGLSTKAVADRVGRGTLHRVFRGVYAVGHLALPVQGRFLAAVLACGPGAVLSHASACVLWKFAEARTEVVDVTVGGQGTHLLDGVRVHRSVVLAAPDMTRRDGIPVTTPARSLIDAGGVFGPRWTRRSTRQALSDGRVSARSLAGALARSRGRRGAGVLRAVLAEGFVPTRSELEDVVLDLLQRAGIAPPEVNAALRLGDRTVIPDFRWPSQRLVLEADGARWHENGIARAADAERQARLEAAGERVIRVTWSEAINDPVGTIARLAQAGAPTSHTPPSVD